MRLIGMLGDYVRWQGLVSWSEAAWGFCRRRGIECHGNKSGIEKRSNRWALEVRAVYNFFSPKK